MHWIDPDHLPETGGTFERFLLNPHGDADGMIFADGTEVHFPPHMGRDVAAAIGGRNGARVNVRGVKPRNSDLIAAVAIDVQGAGRVIDNGPPEKHKKPHEHGRKADRRPMEAAGTIRRVLHGPKGEARGVLLDDGMIVRIAPHEAKDKSALLSPGASFAARGDGIVCDLGTVIEARAIGKRADDLKPLKPGKPKHEGPKHKHDDHDREAAGRR
jgi:hypothetical protein